MTEKPSAAAPIAAVQRLRMRRFMMAIATYGVVLLATPLIARVGMGNLAEGHWRLFLALAVLINGTFYLLFRTGLNLRFRDPSLTQAQILVSAAWGLLPLYDLPQARALILMFYVPPFSFGMLRLNRRQYFVSVAVVLSLFAALLAGEYFFERPGFQPQYQILIFVAFAILLGWLAVFGGFVSDMRRELGAQKRAALAAHEQLGVEMTARARVAAEKEQLIVELQESLVKVKKLSGLLPICASCKKVRDDKGYWSQIETYVRAHSEAEFTHGICPGCAQRLYGVELPDAPKA